MNRRIFLKTAGGALAGVSVSSWGHAVRAAAADRTEFLAEANRRIREHRQGDGVIAVRDSAGRAIAGVKLRLEQTEHEFLFGSNFFRFGRLQEPRLEEVYRERFTAVMNYATLGFYWASYEPERGRPGYEYTDRVVEWCQRHRILCKGHPLVWDYADPKWLPRDFEEIRALSNARVRDIVSRYRGRINIWDVVNEPTHLGRFKTRLGEWALSLTAIPYLQEALRIARAAHATATLLVNDYRTDRAFYEILEGLRADGQLPFDAVGIQSHMHDGTWPLPRVWEVCDTYARLGKPIHFTETTVVSGPRLGPGENWGATTPEREATQAEEVPAFYTALFAHPAVQAITWWDFSDNGAWQRAPSGWLRQDMSPKPVYDRMAELIKKEWWTHADGITGADGQFSSRAFFGRHQLRGELPNGGTFTREIQWKRGEENLVTVTV